MGRMLETLRQSAPRWCAPRTEAETPRTADGDEDEPDGEVPFIEVGGSKKGVTGSPAVLAGVAAPRLVKLAEPVEARYRLVSFRPHGQTLTPERFAAELVAFHHPEHAVSRRYRQILAEMAEHTPAEAAQVVLFTGVRTGVGTTTVVLNLALSLARQGGVRVVVVDANRGRPAVAQRLGLAPAPGLREVLAGTAELTDALQETGLDNLTALAAGADDGTSPTRSADANLRKVLGRLREEFDRVYLDGPACDDPAQTRVLGTVCDAVYLVLAEAEADAARSLGQALVRHGCRWQGSLLTGV